MPACELITSDYPPPIAVGGIGGSGTRLIADCLRELDLFIGGDLNPAYDNLWFTLLFKHQDVLAISDAEFDQRAAVFLTAMVGGRAFTPSQVALVERLAAAADSSVF